MNRVENMIYTQKEDGRGDKIGLTLMYNCIKSMFDFDVEECGTNKR